MVIFLDNYPDWGDTSEKQRMQDELTKLKDCIFGLSEFLCQDAQVNTNVSKAHTNNFIQGKNVMKLFF